MENTNNTHSIEYIYAPAGVSLVHELMDTLPVGILNKKITGCGATSVALENYENTVVCCPTIQLIKNKESQYPNERCRYKIMGVIGGVSPKDIKGYITKCREHNQPVKIMVTYNSFHKVKEIIEDDIYNYKIIVDEFQEILDSCIYKDEVILNFLRQLRDLPNVTYLSATPTPLGYRPDELADLIEYEIIWQDNMMVTPHRYSTNKPYAFVVNMIQSHKQGMPFQIGSNKVEEYFFFVNSIKDIKSIVDNAGLTKEEVKVICANSPENERKLGDITISDLSTPNKTFTFCTKTVFCGADFHSNNGLAIVVSSGTNKNTMLDIATDIQQIAGRIRTPDNPFKNIVLHIYSTGLSCKTQVEFDAWLNKRIQSAQNLIDAYNSLTDDSQKRAIVERIRLNDKEELALYDKETTEVKLNTLKIRHFKYKFESIDKVYRNGMSIREAYLRAGNDLAIAQQWEQIISDYTYNMNGIPRFEVLYKEYLQEKEKSKRFGGVTDRIKEIDIINKFVGLAYKHLTPEKVEALRYNVTNIKNVIHFELPETQAALKLALREHFFEGGEYTDSDAKVLYQQTLDSLGVKKKATSSELKTRFLQTTNKKINKDGQRKNGFEITGFINFLFGTKSKKENFDSRSNIIIRTYKWIMSIFSVK